MPTIDIILKNKGKIVLATHIGRPKGFESELSTSIISQWLRAHGYSCSDPVGLDQTPNINGNNDDIIMLENLRFYAGEKTRDQAFAQLLADCASFYVNDAFGTLHRDDTSIALLPYLFPPEKRTIGLLIETELTALNKLIDHPAQPFVLIIGGGKVVDKLPLLENMIGLHKPSCYVRQSTSLLCMLLAKILVHIHFNRTLHKSVSPFWIKHKKMVLLS